MKLRFKHTLLTMVKRKIIVRGLKGTFQDLWKKVGESADPIRQKIRKIGRTFDLKYQIDTTDVVPATALDVSNEEALQAGRYEPTPVDQFKEMINELPANLEKFVFVDFGSGKGRTLLLASDFPFKRIIGVEFSNKLCEISKENIKNFKEETQPKCSSIDVLCEDAQAFTLPLEPCILYFFNPFNCRTTQVCINNIERSLATKDREIFIIYLNPACYHLFEASTRFVCIKKIDNSKYIYPYYIYASGTHAE